MDATVQVHLVMMGWLPICLGLFLLLPPRRAIIAGFIFALLFLPNHEYNFRGLVDYNKITAASYGLLLGSLIFDWRRVTSFVPSILDLPMLIWCLVPLFSSLANDEGLGDPYGIYDGLSGVIYQTATWGVPYLLGRIYFTDLGGIRDLVIGIVIGGLAYVPLCLYEVRFSPQLHRMVYGMHQHEWLQVMRMGGYRPMVFMSHGLMVGMWMTIAALAAFWLWMSRSRREVLYLPLWAIVGVLVLTAVLCKSALAILMLATGLGIYFAIRVLRSPLPLLIMILFVPTYQVLRVTQVWGGDALVQTAGTLFGTDRANSLVFRLNNEDRITERALARRPLLGWGNWGQYILDEDEGRKQAIPDGMWVSAVGKFGVVGLASLTLSMILPALIVLTHVPGRRLSDPDVAPVVMVAVMCGLFAIDCLMNNNVATPYLLGIGGLGSIATTMFRSHAAERDYLRHLGWRMVRYVRRLAGAR